MLLSISEIRLAASGSRRRYDEKSWSDAERRKLFLIPELAKPNPWGKFLSGCGDKVGDIYEAAEDRVADKSFDAPDIASAVLLEY